MQTASWLHRHPGAFVNSANGIADAHVGPAATQIAAHAFFEVVVAQLTRGIGRARHDSARDAPAHFIDPPDRWADLAWCAIPALKAVLVHEGRLKRTSVLLIADALNRNDITALILDRQRQTREDTTSLANPR